MMPERTMVLRRNRDGSVRMAGSLPDEHTLSARFIQRELDAGLVSVQVTLHLEGGPITYELDGFEPFDGATDGDGEPKLNFTAWRCRLAEPAKRPAKEG
ncbi:MULTISPECIES: hypothetical protein [unclassified Nonomuraea]|uniref:hypothetical protein n=1 Tax=unclassified Nonomuraea TaxID=2593643 RepID=UPI0033CE5861